MCVVVFVTFLYFFVLFTTEPNPPKDYENVWHLKKKSNLNEMNCEKLKENEIFYNEMNQLTNDPFSHNSYNLFLEIETTNVVKFVFQMEGDVEKFVVFNIFNDLMCLFNPFLGYFRQTSEYSLSRELKEMRTNENKIMNLFIQAIFFFLLMLMMMMRERKIHSQLS
jgi:hypothetical protein